MSSGSAIGRLVASIGGAAISAVPGFQVLGAAIAFGGNFAISAYDEESEDDETLLDVDDIVYHRVSFDLVKLPPAVAGFNGPEARLAALRYLVTLPPSPWHGNLRVRDGFLVSPGVDARLLEHYPQLAGPRASVPMWPRKYEIDGGCMPGILGSGETVITTPMLSIRAGAVVALFGRPGVGREALGKFALWDVPPVKDWDAHPDAVLAFGTERVPDGVLYVPLKALAFAGPILSVQPVTGGNVRIADRLREAREPAAA